jgi:hypothetical protein
MTAVEYIKKRIEEDSDTSFSNIDWDKFDKIVNKAKELEKAQDLQQWIETWSLGYNSGWNNCNKKHETND